MDMAPTSEASALSDALQGLRRVMEWLAKTYQEDVHHIFITFSSHISYLHHVSSYLTT